MIAEQTVSTAIALKEHLDNNSVLSTQALEACDYGIAVGSLNFNFHNSKSADIHSRVSLELYLDSNGLSLMCHYFSKLVKSDRCNLVIVYRGGETVTIKDAKDDQKEWVVKIATFTLY